MYKSLKTTQHYNQMTHHISSKLYLLKQCSKMSHFSIYQSMQTSARLPSRYDFITHSTWKKKLESKDVPNKHLVSDHTQQVTVTNLPRREWSTLNRFSTVNGPCLASLHRWENSRSSLGACTYKQTMEHISEAFPLQTLKGR